MRQRNKSTSNCPLSTPDVHFDKKSSQAAYGERTQMTTIINQGLAIIERSKNFVVPSYQCPQETVTTIVRPFGALIIHFAHSGVPRDILYAISLSCVRHAFNHSSADPDPSLLLHQLLSSSALVYAFPRDEKYTSLHSYLVRTEHARALSPRLPSLCPCEKLWATILYDSEAVRITRPFTTTNHHPPLTYCPLATDNSSFPSHISLRFLI